MVSVLFSISYLIISDIWYACLAATKNQAEIFMELSITAWDLLPSGPGQLRVHSNHSSTNEGRIVCTCASLNLPAERLSPVYLSPTDYCLGLPAALQLHVLHTSYFTWNNSVSLPNSSTSLLFLIYLNILNSASPSIAPDRTLLEISTLRDNQLFLSLPLNLLLTPWLYLLVPWLLFL